MTDKRRTTIITLTLGGVIFVSQLYVAIQQLVN